MSESNTSESEMTRQTIDFEAEIQAALRDDRDPESHRELDPRKFHASQIGYCKRQAYLSKIGVKDTDSVLGTFHTGTMVHEFMEHEVGPRLPDVMELETPVEHDLAGVTFVGHADAYDPRAGGVVYDFKSRAGWYNFDPPTQRHMDQLQVYMHALGADHGQIVYISKKDLEVRTYPEDGATFEQNAAHMTNLRTKAAEIRDAILRNGIAQDESEVPFDRCGCWICDNESLDFDLLDLGGSA